MSRHRHPTVRPRYGRISVAAASAAVTGIAVLGGVGALPSAATSSSAPPSVPKAAEIAPVADTGPAPIEATGIPGTADTERSEVAVRQQALPAGSGTGRRVVYSESRQRVWLVAASDRVRRTYLVSGSVYDNLDPGTYSVYSRSEQAWGIDDSGTMRWFVRFAQGDRAAIGFHTIPVDDGARVQTVAELGTPTSHGCIRQRTADAKALWDFAPIGTTVVVTA